MAAKRYYTFAAVAAGQKNMQPDFVALRRQFPLLAHKTYLNSGSYGALSLSVQAAFAAYLEERLTLGANWDGWVAKNEAVRALTAQLLHCLPQEIAVTASVSAGLNALASALDFSGERNQVIVSDFEFPTTAQIWHAQAARGAHIIHVPPAPDGYIPVEQFARSIGERTRLVAITHVCYRNGARLDVPAIVRLAHARGAQVLLDCYQSAGSLDINVRALDVDFAAGGMLKYLIGTAGIGFLYVRDALARTLVPTHTGWFAQADIAAMDIYANTPAPDARRFEAGTPPVPSCYAADAGLKLITDIGLTAIEGRIRELTRRCMERLESIGWPSITPREDTRRGATVAVRSSDCVQLAAELMTRGIVTSHRDHNVRASFHFYNDESDIDSLVAALAELRARFGPV